MPLVKVSSKYQVVIPKSVREALQIQPGQELSMYVLDGHIHLSKPGSITELRGMAKGMRWRARNAIILSGSNIAPCHRLDRLGPRR